MPSVIAYDDDLSEIVRGIDKRLRVVENTAAITTSGATPTGTTTTTGGGTSGGDLVDGSVTYVKLNSDVTTTYDARYLKLAGGTVTGTVTFSSTGSISLNSAASLTGGGSINLNRSGSGATLLTVSQNASIGGTLNVSGNSTLGSIAVSGAASTGPLTVTGATSITGTLVSSSTLATGFIATTDFLNQTNLTLPVTASDNPGVTAALKSGFANINNGATTTYVPTGDTWHHLIHSRHQATGSNYAMQLAMARSSVGGDALYHRQIDNGTAGSWREVLTTASSFRIATNNVAVGTLRDTDSTMFRTATVSTTDSRGQAVGGFLMNASFTRQSDGLAFDGIAISTIGNAKTNGHLIYGPYYKGLKAGQYRVAFYLRVSSTADAVNPVVGLTVNASAGYVVNPLTYVNFTPAQVGSTSSYVSVAIALTVLQDMSSAASGLETIVKYITGSGADVSFSHVTVEPYEGLTPNEVTTTFIKDAAITNAKVNDLSASKITAGQILTDDIQLGNGGATVGRIYAGASKTASTRVEMVYGGTAATSGFFAYNTGTTTVAIKQDGSVAITGTINAAGGTFSGNITSSATITGGTLVGALVATSLASDTNKVGIDSGGVILYAKQVYNYVLNPGFSPLGPISYGVGGAAVVAMDRKHVLSGDQAIRLTGTSTASGYCTVSIAPSPSTTVHSARFYAFSEVDCWIRNYVGDFATWNSTPQVTFVPKNRWTPLFATNFTPPNTNQLYFVVETPGVDQALTSRMSGVPVWFSAPMLTAGATQHKFFYGDMPGCSWIGTQYNSASLGTVDRVVSRLSTTDLDYFSGAVEAGSVTAQHVFATTISGARFEGVGMTAAAMKIGLI